MWNSIVDAVLLFRQFLLLGIAVLLVASFFSLVFCDRLYMNSRRMRFYGLFFAMGQRQLLQLSIATVWLLFVLSCTLFTLKRDPAFALLLLTLCFAFQLVRFQPKVFVVDLLNNIVVYGSLIAQDLLLSYLQEVKFQWGILTVYLLLVLFTLQYTLFFYLRTVSGILSSGTGPKKHVPKYLRKTGRAGGNEV